jgi:hypothetical protein
MLIKVLAGAAITAAAVGWGVYSKNNNISPVTIEELAGKFSDSCDQVILNTQNENNGLKFISGLFKVTLSEPNNVILISADMYFQDENGQWIKKTNHRKLKSHELTKEAISELKELGEVQFELAPPEELTNDAQ